MRRLASGPGALMARRSSTQGLDAAFAAAGFHRRTAGRAGASWRRPVRGRWTIEALREPGRGGTVDLGLTLEPGRGALVGPVHRVPSAAALAPALPRIVASLEALAASAESLRCPDCHAWEVMQVAEDGAFLACGEAGKGRRPFDRGVRTCRRNLAVEALIVYDDRGAPR